MTPIKFYLDENVTAEIAAGLWTRAIDVLTTAEAENKGVTDTAQIVFALSQERVIITHDRDFLRLDSQGVTHAGIVYCAKQSRTVKQMLRRLVIIYAEIPAEEMLNHIEYI